MQDKNFEIKWNNFRKSINNDPALKSKFWQNLIKEFDDNDLDKIKDNLFKHNKYRGYGFQKKSKKNYIIEFILHIFLYFVKITKTFSQKIWLFKNKIFPPHLSDYPLNHYFFKKNKIYKIYQKFCDDLSIDQRTLNASKAFYISGIINKRINELELEKKIFLEIGAGLGGQSISLMKTQNIEKYIIIDLPEMLSISSIALNYFLPKKKISFVDTNTTFKNDGIYLVPNYYIDLIPENFVNISLNIDSFQEMTKLQIETYINLIQKVSSKRAFFLNINRRKNLISENFDNNPLLYPYFSSNKVINWETDNFFDQTSNFLDFRKDPWILREEIIN